MWLTGSHTMLDKIPTPFARRTIGTSLRLRATFSACSDTTNPTRRLLLALPIHVHIFNLLLSQRSPARRARSSVLERYNPGLFDPLEEAGGGPRIQEDRRSTQSRAGTSVAWPDRAVLAWISQQQSVYCPDRPRGQLSDTRSFGAQSAPLFLDEPTTDGGIPPHRIPLSDVREALSRKLATPTAPTPAASALYAYSR
ncbi:hypothetical protein C6P46_003622 [Rhodotorula mucilaginosa]|uniref:Uncharacterized protein n=1 Tax=Rhodotorula mucilaginosa TaxID=5537 RepID=A0A9P7BAA8_RHOMI|nr:hypothetical protein C6P46_003622 [Rhodotorula mucilaginosa]